MTDFSRRVELNYWRPYEEGLYRIIIELSFDSEFENSFLLSETFEIKRQDFEARFSEEQMNSSEEISLTIAEYDYFNDIGTVIIRNDSRYQDLSAVDMVWGLEKLVNGQWYEIPFNDFSPCGGFRGGIESLTVLRGTESEAWFGLQSWQPLTVGVYRLTRMMSKTEIGVSRASLRGDGDVYYPVSVAFEIVGSN
jgi:hypothetical protein